MAYVIHDYLIESMNIAPEKIAVHIIDGETYTYQSVYRACLNMASFLISQDINKHDRVVLILPNNIEHIITIFAISMVGAVFVPIHPSSSINQIKHVIDDCGCKMIVTTTNILLTLHQTSNCNYNGIIYVCSDAKTNATNNYLSFWDIVNCRNIGEPRTVIENDLAAIIYTSGSTGNPKGIMLSQKNLVIGTSIVSDYLSINSNDNILGVLPLNFDYGLNQLLTCFSKCAAYFTRPLLSFANIPYIIEKYSISGCAGIPTTWIALLNQKNLKTFSFSNLRYITNSGGAIPEKYLDLLQNIFQNTKIFLMYGLTEAFRCTYLNPDKYSIKKGSIGKAIPNSEVFVLNSEGHICMENEIGELVYRGATVAMGYWNNKEATDRVFRYNLYLPTEMLKYEKVVYSGDLVYFDNEGYLFFVERNDSLIKSQGFRISPLEIEEALYKHPAIEECIVIGKKDDLVGEKIVAIVKIKQNMNLSLGEVRKFCKNLLPSYMFISELIIVDDIPRTNTGKVNRKILSEQYG